jgi:hypothetical protein
MRRRARLIDLRCRPLLLLGLASALTVADLGFVDTGVTLAVARSKTEQEGVGKLSAWSLPAPRGRSLRILHNRRASEDRRRDAVPLIVVYR